jgi:hypothetical protein
MMLAEAWGLPSEVLPTRQDPGRLAQAGAPPQARPDQGSRVRPLLRAGERTAVRPETAQPFHRQAPPRLVALAGAPAERPARPRLPTRPVVPVVLVMHQAARPARLWADKSAAKAGRATQGLGLAGALAAPRAGVPARAETRTQAWAARRRETRAAAPPARQAQPGQEVLAARAPAPAWLRPAEARPE